MMRRQFRVLHREFLFRIVDRELLSTYAQGDMSKLLVQFAALLIFISLIFASMVQAFEADLQPLQRLYMAWSMEHRLIAATMLVVGLFGVLSWPTMFPDRLDVNVLAPLPVRPRTMFLAKIVAVATALSLTVLALHLAAGLVWPLVLNVPVPELRTPALTSDPAMPPVRAGDLRAVLDRDFAQVLRNGPLAPGATGGVVIGVSSRGTREIFAYGAAKPDTLLEAGSVTKTFTGLLLAHMAVQGQVTLDEPVRALLPHVTIPPPRGEEIRLIDLATHRSSLPRMDPTFLPSQPDKQFAEYNAARLHLYLGTRGVYKRAGASPAYSNLGFGLLGYALATRAGTEFGPLVREVITGPLGMRDTVLVPSPEQQQRFLQGYSPEQHPRPALDVDVLAGAGGFRTTAHDMLTWAEANLHPERLPSAALAKALALSHEPRAAVGGSTRLGLAWVIDEKTGVYSHNGATVGGSAHLFFNPKQDYAIVVLANRSPGAVISADFVTRHIQARLAGEPAASMAEVAVPAAGSVAGALRLYAAYWITMIAAGVFVFGLVMGVQGLAVLLLPRRTFLRASSFLQLGAFALILSVFALQPGIAPTTLTTAQQAGLLAWSPSYWFLGFFQQLNGSPALATLAWRAWVGLGVVIVVTGTTYTLAYFGTLRRIAEEPAIAPGGRRAALWLPRFGRGLSAAVVPFSLRTLLRSPQHRVILAFYLGMGLAIGAVFLRPQLMKQFSAAASGDPWEQVTAAVITSGIMLLGVAVLGTRMAFALPLDLRANWIFRITPLPAGKPQLAARRRAMLVIAVLPSWLLYAAFLPSIWPWQPAVGHLVVLALIGMIFAECALGGVQKIPFTCSYLPGKSSFHVMFWIFLGLLVPLTLNAADHARDALQHPVRYGAMVSVLGLVWLGAWWWNGRMAGAEGSDPRFEEVPADQMSTLDVWDNRFTPTPPAPPRDARSTPATDGAVHGQPARADLLRG